MLYISKEIATCANKLNPHTPKETTVATAAFLALLYFLHILSPIHKNAFANVRRPAVI